MNLNSNDFSLQALEARFEMQRFELPQACEIDCGGGSDYGYYGNSWDNHGSGDGYDGTYQVASDGSGAMLDDGTYTNGSSGVFPTYDTRATLPPNPNYCPQQPCSPPSLCRVCRC